MNLNTIKDGLYIGIDPDTKKNGVAVLLVEERKVKDVKALSLTMYDLVLFLVDEMTKGSKAKVIVEAGWKNAPNWHISRTMSASKCARMGVDVGRNQETGHIIVQFAERLGLCVTEQAPLKKIWGKDHKSKITHDEIKKFIPVSGKTNQEERDALLLAWNEAGLL